MHEKRPEFTWRVAREAWLLVALLGVLAVVAGWMGSRWLAAGALAAALAVMAFFRDPERSGPEDPGLVVAPADGRVIEVRSAGRESRPTIGIFLSIFDVHINRSPVGGEVVAVERTRGRFRAAFREVAAGGNERVAMTIHTPRGDVVCTQIAGLVARRIVCRAQPGDRLEAGERYGLIQFGSRVDVGLPAGSVVLIARGERTRAGVTPMARLPGGSGA
ncbi:MAG TPA: phosphatidylserine decarboxylase [Gemmatimonadota bacterium]|nr:phosphatidylserine decarboxylase [Gemmatimonadota bacterium]